MIPLSVFVTTQAAPAMQLPLKDIVLAAPVSWWPLAPGWWLLIALLLLLLAWFGRQLWLRQRAKRFAKLALERVKQWQQSAQDISVSQVNELLKVVACHYGESEQLAKLSGSRWYQWLQASSTDKQRPQIEQMCQLLQQHLYSGTPLSAVQQEQLLNSCQLWLANSWKTAAHTPIAGQQLAQSGGAA
ncbi:DUF4381 domain-containing protein [Neiella sp. HB171785]|uniref:DUF4381 domain-containing protein n=1 Tax=Neiella litorisoli TaxID=2771431 RepID=A0A8J6QKZ3_9GAMM|nr:DUF4381 domain-containing protein [Neiella litorisoli]MBD1390251.1 DUF4381 domain-containing protein [Neiella litorisoli]